MDLAWWVLPPPPTVLRKVFEVGGLSPDFVVWRAKKSCLMGLVAAKYSYGWAWLGGVRFGCQRAAVVLVRLGGFFGVLLYTLVGGCLFPELLGWFVNPIIMMKLS
jgi:hypothetical protein